MKNKRVYKKALSVLLSTVLLLSGTLPISARAEHTPDYLCFHHQEHTVECGYIAESSCSHQHTPDCYEQATECIHKHTDECYQEKNREANKISENEESNTVSDDKRASASDALLSDANKSSDTETSDSGLLNKEPENCTHVCSLETGCITEVLACAHAPGGEHDETCGYNGDSSDDTEKVCRFVCAICPIQERIDALPSIEKLEDMDDGALENLREELFELCKDIDLLTEEQQAQLDREALDALLPVMEQQAAEAADIIGATTPAEWMNQYTVSGISPRNATINLFDYWLEERDTPDNSNKTVPGLNSASAHWPRSAFLGDNSINRSGNTIHPLVFAGITQTDNWRFGVDGFLYNEEGNWLKNDPGHTLQRYNTYVNPGNGAFQGIVQSTLGENGYPVLNLTEEQVEGAFKPLEESNKNHSKSVIPEGLTIGDENESLAYLFDPDETAQTGKASYPDVKGLLQRDENGYYRYDSAKNFAEFHQEDNKFYLFDTPGSTAYGGAKGQFFPFNSVAEFLKEENDTLVQKTGSEFQSGFLNPVVNHYFGLTLDVDFYQPDGGKITPTGSMVEQEMKFTFSGDDDVWVFIDGVLVADLGGIHDAMGFTINFATGAVDYTNNNSDTSDVSVEDTSLREMYLKAIEDNNGSIADIQGNTITKNNIDRYFRKTGGSQNPEQGTFRSGTEHCLQFYYLERGNQQSNLSLSYNLVPPIADDVVKLDQDNEPMNGVGFSLWTANEDYEKQKELAKFETDENGKWTMLDEQDIPFDFEALFEEDGIKHYVLEETGRTSGYRKTPDIQLEYAENFNILTVTNTWDTGAVGNFNAKIYQVGDLKYASNDAVIPEAEAKSGMVLAVPMMKLNGEQSDYGNWQPMYGSNKKGFVTTKESGANDDATLLMRKRILKAALYQIWLSHQDPDNYPEWHLVWSDDESRYQGTLSDLPGSPDRYYRTDGDTSADLVLSYYFIKGDVFNNMSDPDETDQLAYLKSLVENALKNGNDELDKAIDSVADNLLNNVAQVNLDEFSRLYGSHIYIPNALNTLAVQKLDENGESMEGVSFGLYGSIGAEAPVAKGETDSNGRLLFSATANENETGQVKIALEGKGSTDPNEAPEPSYYLHEIETLDGYELNSSWIPVYVTDRGIYADALARNDGIQVYSGLGKLLGTMTRYAVDGGVNVTLRDLTLTGNENTRPESGEERLNVHYGLDTALLQYGTHEGVLPVFITDEGIGYGQVTQNLSAHSDPTDDFYSPAVKTDLAEKELSHLFTGSTTVVVRNVKSPDPSSQTGRLKISKTVVHSDSSVIDPDKEFLFAVEVEDTANKTCQTDKEGILVTFNSQGKAEISLKHNESLTIFGLPGNAGYTVTEHPADGYTTTAEGETGTIKVNETVEVKFTNTKGSTIPDPKTGSLTVSKTVTGNAGDQTKDWNFTVTLSDTSVNGKYGEMTFTNGVAQFTLKHNQSKTATGLPLDITYEVVEQEANQDGYTTTSTGASGTITENGTAASFVNMKNDDKPDPDPKTGGLIVSKTVSGKRGDTSKDFHFTVTLGDTSIDGQYGDMHSAAHSGRWCGGPAAAVRFKQRPKLVSYIRFNHHGVVLCCPL